MVVAAPSPHHTIVKIGIESKNMVMHSHRAVITVVIPDVKIGWFNNQPDDASDHWWGVRLSAVLFDCSLNKYEYGSIFQIILLGFGISITCMNT